MMAAVCGTFFLAGIRFVLDQEGEDGRRDSEYRAVHAPGWSQWVVRRRQYSCKTYIAAHTMKTTNVVQSLRSHKLIHFALIIDMCNSAMMKGACPWHN